MISLELLNEFIHESLRYNKDIIVDSFTIRDEVIYIKVSNLSNTVKGFDFGEACELNKYYNWLQSRREDKINEILKIR